MKDDHLNFIREIKTLFNTFDVSSIDVSTVELLKNAYKNASNRSLTLHLPTNCSYYYWQRPQADVSEDEREKLMKLFRLTAKDDRFLNLWDDTLRVWRQIQHRPDVDLYNLRSYEDLMRMHDALTALHNTEMEARQAVYNRQQAQRIEEAGKSFAKLQDKRKERFEYENDTFAVRIPKSLEEITREGIELGHCVGGYIYSHASGETNILFLRRKEDESRSFYTIEIRDTSVIQIHGKHNRWLGNDPDAVPFMYEYLQQLGVKFDKTMLLNTGAGYSRSAEYLPESALYAAVPA